MVPKHYKNYIALQKYASTEQLPNSDVLHISMHQQLSY